MGRNRAVWSAEEDEALKRSVETHGPCKWGEVCRRAGLNRCQKSCRLRWKNYLRPGIKRGIISEDEEDLILRMHKLIGNRWSLIAGRLPGRTDNQIKNHWNSYLSKRFLSDKETRNIKVDGDNNHRLIVQSESKNKQVDDVCSNEEEDEERSSPVPLKSVTTNGDDIEKIPSYSDNQLSEPKGSNFDTFLADLEMYLNDYDPQSSTGTNNHFHLAEWINELCDEDGRDFEPESFLADGTQCWEFIQNS